MAYRNISPPTMITVTAAWVDPKRDRPILESLGLVRPLVPLVDQVHNDILVKQGIGMINLEAVLREIRDQQPTIDMVHDRKKRGVHMALTAYAELADDPKEAARFLSLRDRLMPGGRKETLRSYLDQSGDAERLRTRLDSDTWQTLASLATPVGTLAEQVRSWLDAADELGALTLRRMELEREVAQSDDTPAVEREAVYAWIRVVRTVEANLELDPMTTDEIKARILGPLHHAEALADRRASSRSQSPDPNPDDDDVLDARTPVESGTESHGDTGAPAITPAS